MPSEHRLHPSSILFGFASSLKHFALPAVLVALTSGGASEAPPPFVRRWVPPGVELSNWEFWLLIFLIPSALIAIAKYLSFRVRYEGAEIVIRSGILFRNERHIPYSRIQNLDAVRNVVHRALGVTEVKLETGGGDEQEATISVLHHSAFDEMRRRVFAGRAKTAVDAGEEDAATMVPAVEARTLLHLPLQELLLHGFLENRGAILIAAGVGLLWQLGLQETLWSRLAEIGWYERGFIADLLRRVAAGESVPLAPIATLAAVVLGLLLAVRIVSMIWAAVRLYDFRLSRIGQDLRTEYGLFTRVTATVPVRRVQTLTVRQGPFHRVLGRMSVRVETAGGDASAKHDHTGGREWLAPIIRTAAMPMLVREVLPAFDFEALPWEAVHPRAFRRAVKPGLLIGVAVAAPFVGMFGWAGLAVLPFTLSWMAFVTAKQVQHLAWARTEDTVAFRSGWLWRSVTVVPVAKIQAVACAESPFDRRAGMARVQVDTAGEKEQSHHVSIPYLARETAGALHHDLAEQAARTAFRW